MIRLIERKMRFVIDFFQEFLHLVHEKSTGLLYSYTFYDIFLYFCEKFSKMQSIKVKKFNEKYVIIQIRDKKIYWPKKLTWRDLPWLHHEIFDTFQFNPSSYDYPMMDYTYAKWVIDAGCCEGYFSLFFLKRNSSCAIVAIEPIKILADTLKMTFRKYIKHNRFYLEQKALDSKEARKKIYFNQESISDSSLTKPSNHHIEYNVKTITIDTIVSKFNFDNGGIIKMDIEGNEMEALKGAGYTLKNFRPKLAIAVYHHYQNAKKCKEIILKANPSYIIEFRGMNGYLLPPRPYVLFAY